MMIDYYEVLEVSPNASDEVLKKAYRALVQKYHPDQYHSRYKQHASQRTRLINEAYQVLSDPVERRRYNERLAKKTRIRNPNPVGWHVIAKILILAAGVFLAVRFAGVVVKAAVGINVIWLVVSMVIVLGVVWAVTQYQKNGGKPLKRI